MSRCHHAQWRDISGDELVFSIGAVAKRGEGRVFETTTAARWFLAPMDVCSVHVWSRSETLDAERTRTKGSGRRTQGANGNRGSAVVKSTVSEGAEFREQATNFV